MNILTQLAGLWKSEPAKLLPFKLPADPKRSNEEVRPIFWNKRSKTYIYRFVRSPNSFSRVVTTIFVG